MFIVSGEFDKREVDKRHQARVNIASRIFDITKATDISDDLEGHND
ncbi:hypothetical protein FDH01_gp092 [Acinetobacter phage vB_AbaM_ME3]|uniref:Uncharacterized protein n=1 Tax=Acinetobacter phage vB_AbaM_ME3 TaxID=1837876 RepID=A0A172Q0E8_9CAUD|nr:hypothetical protein FDH01_gp092 [Acinetobacter phage vB_AbaM_ME3]AND75253.1 hypothetical protein ME3_92 [Acinetobacter phage vB_AbaM_ME3]